MHEIFHTRTLNFCFRVAESFKSLLQHSSYTSYCEDCCEYMYNVYLVMQYQATRVPKVQ